MTSKIIQFEELLRCKFLIFKEMIGFTLREFSDMCGVPRTTLRRYVNNEANLTKIQLNSMIYY